MAHKQIDNPDLNPVLESLNTVLDKLKSKDENCLKETVDALEKMKKEFIEIKKNVEKSSKSNADDFIVDLNKQLTRNLYREIGFELHSLEENSVGQSAEENNDSQEQEQYHLDNISHQPVEILNKNQQWLLQKVQIGIDIQDIYRLQSDGSFIFIHNHLTSAIMNGVVTQFSHYKDILEYDGTKKTCLTNFIDNGHCYGLTQTLAVRDDKNSARIFVGYDSGHIITFDNQLSVLDSKQLCHNIVTKLKLPYQQSNKLACGDYDGRLLLLDQEVFQPLVIYNHAHVDSINDIAFQCTESELSMNENQLITVGSDNCVLLWDVRIPLSERPAKLITKVFSKPTTLDWPSEYEIAFGTEYGNVVQYDIRMEKILNQHKFFKNSAYDSSKDCSIISIRPLQKGKFLAIITQNEWWIFDRHIKRLIDHKLYNNNNNKENVFLRNCIDIDDGDLLIFGNYLFSYKHRLHDETKPN